jgi:hypothetical protein
MMLLSGSRAEGSGEDDPALTEERRLPRRRVARTFQAGEGEVRGKKHNGSGLAMTSWVARAGIAPARAVIYAIPPCA